MTQVDFVLCKLLNSALFITMLCGCVFNAMLSLIYVTDVLHFLQRHHIFCKSFKFFIDLALLNLLSKCTVLMHFTL